MKYEERFEIDKKFSDIRVKFYEANIKYNPDNFNCPYEDVVAFIMEKYHDVHCERCTSDSSLLSEACIEWESGIPDLIVKRPDGSFYLIELKQGYDGLRREQLHFMKKYSSKIEIHVVYVFGVWPRNKNVGLAASGRYVSKRLVEKRNHAFTKEHREKLRAIGIIK